nr:Hsp20/alpha crystallin family protein [Ralstonia sp. LMG 32967]
MWQRDEASKRSPILLGQQQDRLRDREGNAWIRRKMEHNIAGIGPLMSIKMRFASASRMVSPSPPIGESIMAESDTKPAVKTGTEASPKQPGSMQPWRAFDNLRHEVARVFDDFDRGFHLFPFHRAALDIAPFWRREWALTSAPAVDVVETDTAYEIKADLPGMEEKDVEVKLANGGLTIKGEKQEEKEEKQKDYYLHERHFGAFERSFRMPDGVDADKIQASFKNGVLTVTLPKTDAAQAASKTIPVNGG